MVVVDDLRKPLAVQDAVHVDRLGLRRHVEVAVVVVPGVLLIQPWQAGERPLHRIGLAHVPASGKLLAVRIAVHQQDDVVAQDAHRLGVGAADELIGGLDQLLTAEDLAGVQPTVDPHDRLAFRREGARLVVGQPFRVRKTLRYFLVPLEPLKVFPAR